MHGKNAEMIKVDFFFYKNMDSTLLFKTISVFVCVFPFNTAQVYAGDNVLFGP